MSRLQMDLIDMTSKEVNNFRYILSIRDHFTKYTWAFPLKSKKSEEVAKHLVEIFCAFGAPKILQSDNG